MVHALLDLFTKIQGREMQKKRITIKDIARDCGVSLSTVSLVLNNNPRISESTRQKVLECVRKHGYQPNYQARGLASRSSRIFAVAVPALHHVFADIYFGEIVSGIYERAAEDGYKIMLDIANGNYVDNKEYLNLLKSRRADGLLFIGSSIEHEYLCEFEHEPYPFLLVNHYFPGRSLNYITVNYEESARLACEHLLSLGHRKIGLITGLNTYTGRDFRDAFLDNGRKNGINEKDLVQIGGGDMWDQEGGYNAARKLLDQHPDVTAIMAGNDRMAMGAIRYIQSRGMHVPNDISVMGADNVPSSPFFTPAITTIDHDLLTVGRLACSQLFALFKGEITECREVLPVSLVKRESTGPARG